MDTMKQDNWIMLNKPKYAEILPARPSVHLSKLSIFKWSSYIVIILAMCTKKEADRANAMSKESICVQWASEKAPRLQRIITTAPSSCRFNCSWLRVSNLIYPCYPSDTSTDISFPVLVSVFFSFSEIKRARNWNGQQKCSIFSAAGISE